MILKTIVFNKLNCKMYGHQPEFKHEKDMFGHEYCYQRCFCKRCGERLRSLESNWIPHHYE